MYMPCWSPQVKNVGYASPLPRAQLSDVKITELSSPTPLFEAWFALS